MKKTNILLKKISALFISITMGVGIIPAPISLTAFAQAYESAYPDRINDQIIYDGMEDYEIGTPISKIGAQWCDAGNNQNEYGIVGEHDDTKVIYYEGEHNYSTFCSPGKNNLIGRVWLDVDVKLPENYFRYHFQIGDFTHPDRAVLLFYKDETKLVASGVQDPAGGTKSVTLTESVPQNEWFTLSVLLDMNKEKFTVFIDGEQIGEEMTLNYKFNCATHGTDGPAAGFAKLSFAHRGVENLDEGFSERLYLDNFRLGYAREINPIETMETTVDYGEEYIFPQTLSLPCDDGSLREFKVIYTPVGNALDENTLGAYEYIVEIEHYPKPVTAWFYVKERQISAIETIYKKIYKGQNYSLPATVTANMSDGGTKEVPVVWNGVANTEEAGIFTYTGTVEGWGSVTLNLEVMINAVLRAEDYYFGVAQGEEYTLPTELNVIMTNHKYAYVPVTWDAAASEVDTSVLGKYEFSGRVEGYSNPIKLYFTVYEYDSDLENIKNVLIEYYNNVLTIGRDRSKWFPDEYAAGYDPALGPNYDYSRSSMEETPKPYSPLPSIGIDRDTNYHANWPCVTGKRPLASPANQGPLWKGLQGMTVLTGDKRYFEAVVEAHDYVVNNYVSETSKMLEWGDHILQQFDNPALDVQVEKDSYSYMTHQLECDYPEVDMLFAGNPEAAERYIKALWTGHFNGQQRGILLNTMEFSRHASCLNTWSLEQVDNVFKVRYDFDDVLLHEVSENALTFVLAAVDYVWMAVKLWQNTGDEDALHYARKLLWCYHAAADPDTGLIPFQYTDTGAGNIYIGDVYHPSYTSWNPLGRMKSSYSKVYKNPEKYGTSIEKLNDSWLLNQGKYGGGSYYMPLICFAVADLIGGEVGAEIEEWGIEAMMGFVNYTYDHKTGLGKSGMTDGTVLDDYKPEYSAYYRSAGSTHTPFVINGDMAWLLLDGYERTQEQKVWDVVRSICMSLSMGDIGTAPGENIDLDIYTDCDDPYIIMMLSRLYELTGSEEYYNLAKRIVKNIISERFINGFFYKSSLGAYARMTDVAPYCILYFVAASQGISKNIPRFIDESHDFQTMYVTDSGEVKDYMGYSLFNQTIVNEVLASAVLCDIEELELAVGEQYAINAEVFPEDADDLTLEWNTDNTGICIVEDGFVTAIAPGTCIVTAEAASGVSASVKITVKE